MKRTTTSVPVGDNQERVRVRIEGDECESQGVANEFHLRNMLAFLSNDPTLVYCGLEPFQTLKLYHTGRCWTVETEAVVEKKG